MIAISARLWYDFHVGRLSARITLPQEAFHVQF